MNNRLKAQLKAHDYEDKKSICSNWNQRLKESLKEQLSEEEQNAWQQVLESELEESEKAFHLVQQASLLLEGKGDFGIPIFTRKSEKLNIRKHTASVIKYFHKHSFYEMIYVYDGDCIQYIDNDDNVMCLSKKQVCKQQVCEQQVCFLSPLVVHALEPAKENDIVLKLAIPVELFENIARSISTEEFNLIDEMNKNQGIYCVNAKERSDLFLIGLLDEAFRKKEFAHSAAEHYVSLMIIELLRAPDYNMDYEFQDKVMDYIEQNLTTANLREFAMLCGYSESHTSRVLKSKCNISFTELLKKKRIKKAAKMLMETELSVENIALQLGYENTSGFYKQFNAMYGVSPKQYRILMN